MTNSHHHVAVLGASPKPARYANQCIRLLQHHGYTVTPVHPRFALIEELPVSHSLAAISDPVDTLTLYVGPKLLEPQAEDIVRLKPGRVIFNPGTESAAVQERLTQQILVALQALLETDDVAVTINAVHYCVKSRGVMDSNSKTRTTALGGAFKSDGNTRAEFIS